MAETYSYSQALNVAAKQLPKILEDQYAALACNFATSLVWDAADWDESLAALPPFYLQPGEQDHGPPLPLVPSDFEGLRRAQIQDYQGQVYVEVLAVSQNLNETWVQGVPTSISYEAAKKAFRLFPRVPNGYCAPVYFVTGTYKKRAVQITNSTLDALLPLDDKYFFIWVEALRWAFFQLSGDSKAGEVTIQDGRKVYTGQLAKVMHLVELHAAIRDANSGEHRLSPSAPLVRPRFGYR